MKEFFIKKMSLGLISIVFTLIGAHKANAVTLFCSMPMVSHAPFVETDGFEAEAHATCSVADMKPRIDHDGTMRDFVQMNDGYDSFDMRIKGLGLGLRTTEEAFVIVCPAIFKAENLKKHKFYGVRVSAAALVGANVAIFSNKRGGVCIWTGLGAGIGASVAGAEIDFK